MASEATPSLSAAEATAVIDPTSYAAWDPVLDLFDRIRDRCPVAKVESSGEFDHEPFWLLTRHEDVMRVSKDNATFLNNPRSVVFSGNLSLEFVRGMTGGSDHAVASLVTFDGPIHSKYRQLTSEWFSPKNLRQIEGEIRSIAKTAIDRLISSIAANGASDSVIDFCQLVSAPYPLHVVMQILGVPEQDEPLMLTLTQKMFGGSDADLSQTGVEQLTPEQATEVATGAVRMFEQYFAKISAERRANPQGDVASAIANAVVDGEPLSDRDMMGYYIIVAAAGHDTTSASTAGTMLALAQDRQLWDRVKANRNLLGPVIEEAIRWSTPVQHFMRTAARDTEIGGQRIAKGDWMMLSYVAANHDPDVFDNPRQFDPTRSYNRHSAFGAGAHQCLGQHLARLEMRILFEELLDRIDSVELAGEAKRSRSTFVGGLKTLPLRIVPA